jgi:hypothetical protein
VSGFTPAGYTELCNLRTAYGAEKLGTLLAAGALRAFRINAWGDMFPISAAEWRGRSAAEMIESGETVRGLGHGGGQRIVIRLAVKSSLAQLIWPPSADEPAKPASLVSQKKRGPSAATRERVKSEMRKMGIDAVAKLKQTALADLFGVSRETCVKALKEIRDESSAVGI